MLKFWAVLVVLTALVSVWFFGVATHKLWRYFSLNAQTKAEVYEWVVVEESSSKFVVASAYRFQVKERGYKGKTYFADPYYLNAESAENSIKRMGKKEWDVWYNSKDPTDNSLQKMVPFKVCIQFILVLGVGIYFFFLKDFLIRSGF